MKISTLILSVCGFCVFYICNADWIDELIENYLGSEYEEVAPFISSVTAGTEEFDQIVRELSQSKRKWWLSSPLILVTCLCFLSFTALFHCHDFPSFKRRDFAKFMLDFLNNFRKPGADREEIQNVVSEFFEKKLKQLCGIKKPHDVPVKLLWKGGTLVESSVYCSAKEESKLENMQRHLLHSKLLFKSREKDKTSLIPSSSESSTVEKMAEIRQLLESEQELQSFMDKGAETDDGGGKKSTFSRRKVLTQRCDLRAGDGKPASERMQELCERENKKDQTRKEVRDNKSDSDWDVDPKIMNRIRLLESRLRLEELKNKNWINRMSKAEGILQQLNKQVERIEETRPVGTLTETLKITSTVTNWAPSSNPSRNVKFTLVNRYSPYCRDTSYTSLSELIKNEVGLSSSDDYSKDLFQLPPTPQIPALPSPIQMPQSSFLSKFLFR